MSFVFSLYLVGSVVATIANSGFTSVPFIVCSFALVASYEYVRFVTVPSVPMALSLTIVANLALNAALSISWPSESSFAAPTCGVTAI